MTREYKDSDYEDYKSWYKFFEKRGAVAPLPEMLSDDGIVVECDNQKICIGFLYTTNSNIALMEFVIANPKAPRDIRKKSVKKLLTSLETLAINRGYEILLVYTTTPSFIQTLTEGFGFNKGAKSQELIKVLY